MLTLTRKIDETIIIGEGDGKIVIVLRAIRGSRARISIIAPRDKKIRRGDENGEPQGTQRQIDKTHTE